MQMEASRGWAGGPAGTPAAGWGGIRGNRDTHRCRPEPQMSPGAWEGGGAEPKRSHPAMTESFQDWWG